ncbi:hypothetical protein LNP74_09480 [Klebsiella pneumoniae subsp. pneumoniae]|nr:hypothetical protein [Klebsiella pneumoniae subsp. pneumoniae]
MATSRKRVNPELVEVLDVDSLAIHGRAPARFNHRARTASPVLQRARRRDPRQLAGLLREVCAG